MVAPTAVAPPSDPTAVFGRRLLAAIIDIAILFVPAVMLASSQFEYLELADGRSGTEFCDQFLEQSSGACFNLNDTVYFSDASFGATQAVGLGLQVLLLVLLQGLLGWTPGKLLTGIRTVREDGRPAGIGRAALRWVLLIVDGQPCGLPLVGLITGLTTKGHRRVGDMAAKTFVVRAAAAGAPIVVPGLTAPAPPEGYGSGGGWGGPPPPTAAAAPAGAPAPQWDAVRGTYIQWDLAQNAWMQWDEPGQRWFKIQGQ